MNSDQKIEPQKVTKPIQLLVAWLVGLIIVNGSFLTAAGLMEAGSKERIILVIAAIINVPVFLIAMFLLQTRFRPELQEDSFYSQYLDKKTNKIVTVPREEKLEVELISIKNQIAVLAARSGSQSNGPADDMENKAPKRFRWKVGVNDYLDNYSEVRELLKKDRIPVSGIFGSLNSNGKPEGKKVSFSRAVDFASKKRILLLASELGFEAYDYITQEEEDYGAGEESILIGSYGDIDETTIPISSELLDLLNSDPEPVDLKYYESKLMSRIRSEGTV